MIIELLIVLAMLVFVIVSVGIPIIKRNEPNTGPKPTPSMNDYIIVISFITVIFLTGILTGMYI